MSQFITDLCYIIAAILFTLAALAIGCIISAVRHRNKQRARLIRRATRRW